MPLKPILAIWPPAFESGCAEATVRRIVQKLYDVSQGQTQLQRANQLLVVRTNCSEHDFELSLHGESIRTRGAVTWACKHQPAPIHPPFTLEAEVAATELVQRIGDCEMSKLTRSADWWVPIMRPACTYSFVLDWNGLLVRLVC